MDDIFNEFQNNVAQIRQIGGVYSYLKDNIRLPITDIDGKFSIEVQKFEGFQAL